MSLLSWTQYEINLHKPKKGGINSNWWTNESQTTYSCETHRNPYLGMDLQSRLKAPKIDKA